MMKSRLSRLLGSGSESGSSSPDETQKQALEHAIELPLHWNSFSTIKRVRGLLKRCQACFWSGDPAELFRADDDITLLYDECQKSAEQAGCVSCKIITRLMEAIGLPGSDYRSLGIFRGPAFGVEDDKANIDTHWTVFITGAQGKSGPKGLPRFPKIPGDTSSEASLEWVKKMMSGCQKAHPQCGGGSSSSSSSVSESSFLPTRLICVTPLNDDGDVVLRDKVDVPAESRYTALSHCWGTKLPDCLTTKQTLSDRKARVPWATLPKTFQDAVDFTRRLGIEYLWIDSLCIIQGDRDDWSREAGRMFHVYRNAYVTLAAYHSHDSSGGLYSRLPHEPQTRLGTVRLGRQGFELWARRTFKHYPGMLCHTGEGGAEEEQKYAPLFTRAWTFQERLVSPRVVLFARGEMIWECARYTACECQSLGTADDIACPKVLYGKSLAATGKDGVKKGADRLQTINEFVIDPSVKNPPPLSQMSWHVIVAAYSVLNITNPTDRLPAISAIAEQISATKPGQRYLAGCWSSSLIDDLMWEASPLVNNRPENWRAMAPSWSWASVRSSVDWNHDQTHNALAEVVRIDCTSADGNPFGVPADGEISLRGRLLPCVLEKHWSPDVQISPFSVRHGPSKVVIHFTVRPDEDDPPAAARTGDGASGRASGGEPSQEDRDREGSEPDVRVGKTKSFRVEVVYKKDIFLLELAENSEAREVPQGVSWLEREKVCLMLKRVEGVQDKYSRLGVVRTSGPSEVQEVFSEFSETVTVVIV